MTPDPRYPATRHGSYLAGLVRVSGWRRGAEIGLLKGKTFGILLDQCVGLELLIGVDQWRQLDPSSAPGAEHYRAHDMAVCEAACREIAARHPGRARILKGDSAVMAAAVADASLDFVFIDGGHTEAQVRADIAAWAPKVRPSGRVLGHDWNWPSVKAALDDLLPDWQGHPEAVWSAAAPAGETERAAC